MMPCKRTINLVSVVLEDGMGRPYPAVYDSFSFEIFNVGSSFLSPLKWKERVYARISFIQVTFNLRLVALPRRGQSRACFYGFVLDWRWRRFPHGGGYFRRVLDKHETETFSTDIWYKAAKSTSLWNKLTRNLLRRSNVCLNFELQMINSNLL